MKYVFLVAFQKGNKNLIKVRTLADKEIWATTSEAVFNYAKKSCKKDTEYEFQTEEKNGQLHISLIGDGVGSKKEEVKTTYVPSQSTESSGPKCEVCGKALKDAKYKKCFECNKRLL